MAKFSPVFPDKDTGSYLINKRETARPPTLPGHSIKRNLGSEIPRETHIIKSLTDMQEGGERKTPGKENGQNG